MIGLTSLWINGRDAVATEIDRHRAVLVLGKIDEILSWEKTKEQEKDVRLWSSENICARCGRNGIGG